MKNLGQMMKQAQAMQAKMAEVQEKLGQLEVTGQSGAGLVKATLKGKSELRGLKIDTSLVDPSEVEVMADIIVAGSEERSVGRECVTRCTSCRSQNHYNKK